MTLRALVPSAEFLRLMPETSDDVETIVWHIDDPAGPPDAEVLVTAQPAVAEHRSRIRRIPSLRHVHLLSLGYDWVPPLIPEGVTLSNSRGAVEDSTAELGVALVIAGLRRFAEVGRLQVRHEWLDEYWTGTLFGSRVLVLGVGGVGQAVMRRLDPFEPASVTAVGRTARTLDDGRVVHGTTELPGLLPDVDVVVIALPLSEDTTGLVDRAFLAGMRDGALLVNIGRGGVVDSDALAAELGTGRLRAALDVVDPEPLPADHPLWSAPGCLITPHIGGDTKTFQRLSARIAAQEIGRIAAGAPPRNLIALPGR